MDINQYQNITTTCLVGADSHGLILQAAIILLDLVLLVWVFRIQEEPIYPTFFTGKQVFTFHAFVVTFCNPFLQPVPTHAHILAS